MPAKDAGRAPDENHEHLTMASTPRESELEAKLRERDAQVKALQQHVAELSERLSTDTSRTMDDVRAYTPAGHLLIPTAVQQRHSERFNGTHWLHTAASRSDLSDKDLFTRHFPAELTYWRTQHMPCLEQTQRMPHSALVSCATTSPSSLVAVFRS
jgi:hypothetical protein